MSDQDIRWIQRFAHYSQAFSQLKEAVELAHTRRLSKLEEQGLIQAFEFTHELAWNTLKDFLEERGAHDLYGSRDATREAFKRGLIENGEAWMDMIKSRNLTSHTYNDRHRRTDCLRHSRDVLSRICRVSRPNGLASNGKKRHDIRLERNLSSSKSAPSLRAHPQVSAAILYGSRAKGNYQKRFRH